MAGFSREGFLYKDGFSANLTEIGRYSPTLSQNIPVFREPRPETGSTTLNVNTIIAMGRSVASASAQVLGSGTLGSRG